MKKVPLTTLINSWLDADTKIAELCKSEDCEYHSDSAYRGYVLGFEEGVNTQVVDHVEVDKLNLVTKHDIAKAFDDLKIGDCAKYVNEDDCIKYISSSNQYWFFAGAMWLMERMKENKNAE